MNKYDTSLKKLYKHLVIYIFFCGVVAVGFTALVFASLFLYTAWDRALCLIVAGLVGVSFALLGAFLSASYSLKPFRMLQQAIKHVSEDNLNEPAPDIDQLRTGRELVTSLANEVYKLARTNPLLAARQQDDSTKYPVPSLPLPLCILDKEQDIVEANEEFAKFIGKKDDEIVGKPLYESLRILFSTDATFEAWLTDCKANKVTDTMYWERVRFDAEDGSAIKQFDMAARYQKDDPNNMEVTLLLFDHTLTYNETDNDVGFIALAVHELRTPLTIMRGYIEVFEDELGPTLNSEMQDFMRKLNASAEQLTGFVSNILNVARIDANQLDLNLLEEQWEPIVTSAVGDMELRAQVRGKHISLKQDPNLETVGVDRISIYEVLTNLLDNSIKYSSSGKDIEVKVSKNAEGLIETSIHDYGAGIPTSVAPTLFEKYARNHRNSTQVGGTGLGLYLCKSIVSAHGGNIWLSSKEGEGATFTFTVLPYTKVATDLKESNNKAITRSAHGWIKNHSMYRR